MPTEFLMPLADEHYDVDPPTQAEIDFDGEIDRFIFAFWKVTLSHIDVTFELPLALGSLRKFRPAFQLDGERRDKLIRSIADAAVAVVQKLPAYSPPMVVICLSAATIIVRHWAQDEQERAAHHPHRLVDARMYVRMLERDLRNISDFTWLQQRKAQRQQEVVRSMLTLPDTLAAEQVAA
ncbi:hypothetical protein NKH61_24560 [Mesorhizobium sp. M1005]|uniref:hypothetical protein n=1 Tax=unclassified Mesorhizobium TaxID=325217 RepID=UPI003339611F